LYRAEIEARGGCPFLTQDNLPDDGPTGGFFHLGQTLPW
jgi:hypothetical protein